MHYTHFNSTVIFFGTCHASLLQSVVDCLDQGLRVIWLSCSENRLQDETFKAIESEYFIYKSLFDYKTPESLTAFFTENKVLFMGITGGVVCCPLPDGQLDETVSESQQQFIRSYELFSQYIRTEGLAPKSHWVLSLVSGNILTGDCQQSSKQRQAIRNSQTEFSQLLQDKAVLFNTVVGGLGTSYTSAAAVSAVILFLLSPASDHIKNQTFVFDQYRV